MTRFRQNILVSIIGLLTALILLEAGLRLTGAFYMKDRLGHKAYNQSAGEDAYTILCLGNSWTLGLGTSPGISYPDHLRRMLQDTFKDIRLINAGVGNLNSAELLDRLKPQISSIRPDLIILMTGTPNTWNYHKYSQYLKRENRIKNPFYRMMLSVNDSLYAKSRVYRLTQLLAHEIRSKTRLTWGGASKRIGIKEPLKLSPDRLEEARQLARDKFYEKFRSQPGYIKAVKLGHELGELFLAMKDASIPASDAEIEEAITWLKGAIKYSPHDWQNYAFLGNIYGFKKDYKKSAEFYIEGIKMSPCFWDEERKAHNLCYLRLEFLYSLISDSKVKKKIEVLAEDLSKTNPETADLFLWINSKKLDEDKIAAWIESDVEEIVRIIKSNGIGLIMQTYPPPLMEGEGSSLKLANVILRRRAMELNIPFVDNEALFLEIYAQGQNQEDYHETIIGETGRHFNSKGYNMMAKFVYDKIIEEGFISRQE